MKTIKRFGVFLAKYRGHLIVSTISAFVTAVSGVLGHIFFGLTIDQAIGKNQVNFNVYWFFLGSMMAVYLVEAVSNRVLRLSSNKMAYKAVRDVRDDGFSKLEKVPLSYIDRTSHGDIISRFTNDMDSVSTAISLGFSDMISGVFSILACIIAMFYYSWELALVIILSTPLTLLLSYLIGRFTHNIFSRQQQVLGELSGFINEEVGGSKVISVLGYEKESMETFKEKAKKFRQISQRASFISTLVNPISRFLDHSVYVAVGVVGAYLIISGKSTMPTGILTTFFVFANSFTKPFNRVSAIMSNLQTAYASLQRMFSFLDEKEEPPEKEDAIIIDKCHGEVDFSHVDFSYFPGKPLISDFNFKTTPGDLVAIVGPTGAGKTTLVNLLMRFYDIDHGSISIDSIDILDLKRDNLRGQFGMVLQDTWLFSGTIAQNIAYGVENAKLADIKNAAKAAYVDRFIESLEHGYDTIIGESSNIEISGGQRQLLTIARVILMNPPMLILDEATSSVDTLTEFRIQSALDNLMEGKTSFVIAHRLSTIVAADRILMLEDGNIVEQGKHEQLLEAKGKYYDLYNSQFS